MEDQIYQAIKFLNSRNGDGARELNGVGFNKVDSFFGAMAANSPVEEWTTELRWTAYKMIAKYRGQLESAGIIYSQIPVPEKPDKDDATTQMLARQAAKSASANKIVRWTKRGLLVNWGGYNSTILAHFKEVFPASNERQWDADNTKDWFVFLLSLDTIERLFEFCRVQHIKFTDEALSFIQLKVEEFEKQPHLQKEPVNLPAAPKVGRFIEPSADNPAVMNVHFDYHPELVDRIKEFHVRVWNVEKKFWAVNIGEEKWADDLMEFAAQYGFEERGGAFDKIRHAKAQTLQNVQDSMKAETDFRFEGLLREPYMFQWAGCEWGVKYKRTIIGDDMGLGKTIQSIMITQHLKSFPALCVVPKTVDLNWAREWSMTVPNLKVNVFSETTDWKYCDVFIINYDMLSRKTRKGGEETWKDVLLQRKWQTVIADEAHMLKSSKTLRTKAVKELAQSCSVRLMLTGTPILNRPVELVSLLDIIGRLKEDFGGWKAFTSRYCSSRPIYVKGKLVQSNAGAHNLSELHQKLRSSGAMIRRLKKDVLKDLPAKTYTLIPVELDNREEYEQAEADVIAFVAEIAAKEREFLDSIAHLDEEDQMTMKKKHAQDAAAKAERAEVLVRINTLRQLTAKGKMAAVKEWITEFTESEEKLVFFGWHRNVVEGLAESFSAPSITGDTKNRQAIVDRFQQEEDCRHIFLNIQAGGVGITLTAASNVGFCELPWTPSFVDQAVDRCHRIGQEDAVTAWFLIAPDTIDMDMYQMIEFKRRIINTAIDGISLEEQEASALSDVMTRMLDRSQKETQQKMF